MPHRWIMLLGVLLLVSVSRRTVQAQVAAQDSLALVALYNATDGPNWTNNTNWLTGPVSEWLGVTVTGGVTGLGLAGFQLTGPIPPALGNLANLTFLDLNGNQLMGPLPPALGNLANLTELYLNGNQLTGPIPPELGTLSNLNTLDLEGNQLTGSVPPALGNLSNLIFLVLNGNQLTGAVPPALGNLSNLTFLRLDNNQLTGAVPPELGNLSNLTILRLTNNQLTGSVAPALGNLSNLATLRLDSNQLTGPIPPELGNLANLTVLNLGDNQLTGSVPPALGNLTNLTNLRLLRNLFSGTLPLSLTNLSMLDTFWFSGTDLCEPTDPDFQAWLQGISNVQSTGCTNVVREEKAGVPTDFALESNYPNPFNPTTVIRYALPQQTAVHLSVYDVQGRLVAVLVASEQPAGRYEVAFDASVLSSGVYLYRLETPQRRFAKTMQLVK